MSAVDVSYRSRPSVSPGRALRMVVRQTGYEQLTFWRNPVGAGFTIGFSTLFLILLSAAGGSSRMSSIGGLHGVQYYVPGFLAYGIMSACFQTLAITLVARREAGLLKRLRLSPLPASVAMASLFASVVIVSIIQTVILLAIGRLAYHLQLPHNYLALLLALVVGAVCFTSLGVAASTVIPNQEAAGPVLGLVFFVLLWLSGLWYPIGASSVMARISSVFPIRHLIVATFAPFDLRPGQSAWAWGDLGVMLVWGVVGAWVGTRHFRWAPRRGQ